MSALPPDIAAILAFNETGAQFFKRVQQERVLTGLPVIDNNLSLRPGVVLEVAGPSGSGKTELLLSIALHVLLSSYADPKAWLVPPQQHRQQLQNQNQEQHLQQSGLGTPAQQSNETSCPRTGGSVVILDLDGKFDGVRLMQVLEPQVLSAWRDQQQQRLGAARGASRTSGGGGGGGVGGRDGDAGGGRGGDEGEGGGGGGGRGRGGGPGPPGDPVAAGAGEKQQQQQTEPLMLSPDLVVEDVLSRLHLVRCRSSLQLLAALAGLPTKLEALQAAGSPCRLLLIDNVGAHYWRDRAARNVPPPGGAHASHHQLQHHYQHQQHPQQQPPLALSLFEIHAALAARLAHLSRGHRLPVVATKAAAVTALGLEAGGGELGAAAAAAALEALGSEGAVQLQQREFMPMPWQSMITHRLLLWPLGVIPGPAPTAGAPPPHGSQHTAALQSLTAILAQMLGAVGQAVGASTGAGLGSGAAPGGGGGGCGGSTGGRGLGRLLVSSVALVEEW